MIKILIIFGTRPECIKMAPIIRILKQRDDVNTVVCNTEQHTTMTDQILDVFGIKPDYNLGIMGKDQTLTHTTRHVLNSLEKILKGIKPDLVLLQGDTTSTFVSSLASFYHRIPVGHIEAGLRTLDRYNPFPEEINRRLTTVLAEYHFAPTKTARKNLLLEGIREDRIFVTGNTVIDALFYVVGLIKQGIIKINTKLKETIEAHSYSPLILITAHRRESFGTGLKNICLAIKDLSKIYPEYLFIYPVHLNPNVKKATEKHLKDIQNVLLIEPLDYFSFVFLMDKSYLILTDSGGIQEEAPSLGKPTLVLREKTERPEGIEAGVAKIVGVNRDTIVTEARKLLEDKCVYQNMSEKINPYGDGRSANRIVDLILSKIIL